MLAEVVSVLWENLLHGFGVGWEILDEERNEPGVLVKSKDPLSEEFSISLLLCAGIITEGDLIMRLF